MKCMTLETRHGGPVGLQKNLEKRQRVRGEGRVGELAWPREGL
jgi:hypothetical protein